MDLGNTISQDSIIYPINLLNTNDPNVKLNFSKAIFCYKIYGSKRSWYTCVGRHKRIGMCHPLFDLGEIEKTCLITFLNFEMYQIGITRVNCHYQIGMFSKNNVPLIIVPRPTSHSYLIQAINPVIGLIG